MSQDDFELIQRQESKMYSGCGGEIFASPLCPPPKILFEDARNLRNISYGG